MVCIVKSGDNEKRLIIDFPNYTESALVDGRINENSRIVLNYGRGGYYMGDPSDKDNGPRINYVEICRTSEKVTHHYSTPLSSEQLEEIFGIKIIRFEFSSPIENEFVPYTRTDSPFDPQD